MKLAKIASLLLAPVFAVLLAGAARPPAAQATVRDIITLNPSACLALSVGNWANSQTALFTCIALNSADNLDLLAQVLRQADELPKDLTPEDFTAIDQDGGQLHQEDGTLFVVAFVSNDDPVSFFADKGGFNESSGRAEAFCGPGGEPSPSYDFVDEDCNDNGIKGDGVVVATLTPGSGLDEGDRGEAEVRVRQDNIEIGEPYVVVGEPHRIEITPSKTVIQTGLDVSDKYDGVDAFPEGGAIAIATGKPRCDMFSDTATFLNALRSPEITPITAKITDDDGTPVAAAWTAWTISNPDGAAVSLPDAPALDLSSAGLGIVAPNVLCGLTEAGDVTLTGRIVTGPSIDPENPDARAGLDSKAEDKDAEVTITIKDPPTNMALSASPASLACDGVNSSTISATLTDAEANSAVNGNRVHWQIRALGTVNPLDSGTGDGVATTALTPLAGVIGGVVTRAWLELPVAFEGDEGVPKLTFGPGDDFTIALWKVLKYPPIKIERTALENTALVACEGTAAEQPGLQPAAGQQPVIAPPSTGSGGSSGGQSWFALPLTAAALLAIGTGLVLKRRAA